MKLAIDITDCINGWRVDIIDNLQRDNAFAINHKENFTTADEAFQFANRYILSKAIRKPPYNTMEVI